MDNLFKLLAEQQNLERSAFQAGYKKGREEGLKEGREQGECDCEFTEDPHRPDGREQTGLKPVSEAY